MTTRSEKQKVYRKRWNKSAHGRAVVKAWYKRQPETYQRDRHLKSAYGMTWEDKVRMYEGQKGLCKACRRPLPPIDSSRIHIDHDHNTKKIGGLLHEKCNRILGFEENQPGILSKILEYKALREKE